MLFFLCFSKFVGCRLIMIDNSKYGTVSVRFSDCFNLNLWEERFSIEGRKTKTKYHSGQSQRTQAIQ